MKKILLAGLLLAFCGCTKQLDDIDNLSGGRVYIIGHGGSGFASLSNNYAPNSWSSVTRAVDYYRADGVEIDVQMSADHVLFMFHDQNLDAASTCTGCLYSYDSAALTQCSFRSVQGQVPGDRLTPLEDVIRKFAAMPQKPMVFLDLHANAGYVDTRKEENGYYYNELIAVNRLLETYNAFDWVHIQSDNRRWMLYAKNAFPKIRILLDYVEQTDDVDFAVKNGFFGIAGYAGMPQDLINTAHSNGLKVQLYGAASKNDIVSALNQSPDYYLADNILLLQQILAR